MISPNHLWWMITFIHHCPHWHLLCRRRRGPHFSNWPHDEAWQPHLTWLHPLHQPCLLDTLMRAVLSQHRQLPTTAPKVRWSSDSSTQSYRILYNHPATPYLSRKWSVWQVDKCVEDHEYWMTLRTGTTLSGGLVILISWGPVYSSSVINDKCEICDRYFVWDIISALHLHSTSTLYCNWGERHALSVIQRYSGVQIRY